ncbi:unnamed protein product [Ceratitis capitata]|uniref:(Mediterranean fruit fly) hypothetical protein n=1 Tax=Ceratitis capitata TaxID=7213 RepID=A0A811VGM7_CERCA|nr:unnamed protein product [Ceratitis capitata]
MFCSIGIDSTHRSWKATASEKAKKCLILALIGLTDSPKQIMQALWKAVELIKTHYHPGDGTSAPTPPPTPTQSNNFTQPTANRYLE